MKAGAMIKKSIYLFLVLMIVMGCANCGRAQPTPEVATPGEAMPAIAPTAVTTPEEPTPALAPPAEMGQGKYPAATEMVVTPKITPLPTEGILFPVVTPPTKSPFEEPPVVVSATPQVANTYIPPTPTPSATPDNAGMELVDACALVQPDDLRFIFPVTPEPVYQAVDDGVNKASACSFKDGDRILSIMVAMDFDSVSGLYRDLENIRERPEVLQFLSSGAEIYLETGVENGLNALAGLILRDDVSVQIFGGGYPGQPDLGSETRLLTRIAERLPPYTRIADRIKACSLVKEEEIGALFPNPPQPQNKMIRSGGDISECTYDNGEMSFRISLGFFAEETRQSVLSYPGFIRILIPGGEVYVLVGPNNETGVGGLVLGAVFKNGLMVVIDGKGLFYQYDLNREGQLLTLIGSRLP